jgi:hypothetical protein
MPFRLRSGLAGVASAIDRTAVRLPPVARALLLGPVLFSVMVGSGVWALRNPALLSVLNTNKQSEPDTIKIFKHVLGALCAFLLVNAVAVVWRRVRTGHARPLETTAAVQRYLLPLLALPLFAIMNMPGLERESPKTTLFFAAIAAVIVGAGIYAWPVDEAPRKPPRSRSPSPSPSAALGDATGPPPDGPPPVDPDPPPSRGARFWAAVARWGAGIAVVALWAGYGYFFSRIAITNHHALNTRTTDLGYYDNIFYQTIHGKLLACGFTRGGTHSSAHFDPILIVLSPF